MKNWKTTLTGILTIVVALGGAALHWLNSGELPDLTTLIAALTAGGGLLVAGDAKPKEG